jgi:predicted nuclease of predicted toxin-antitoxin system
VAALLLADENVPGAVVAALRQQGHNVAWIHEDAPGSPDAAILERAQRENRVVVTFDKDFGELAFHSGLTASVGVVLFRISLPSPDHAARIAVAAFASRAEWTRQFAVVEDDRIRLRTLPGSIAGASEEREQ